MPPGTLQTPECLMHCWVPSACAPSPWCVCVSVCVCERVSESLRFYYLSASPGEVWSSCSVFFTSLAIFSSHCGSLHIPGSGSQLWICGQSETSEYISQKKKTDKTPSISITSSPQKAVAILGISMWFWGDESGVRRRREDAGSYRWTENTPSLYYRVSLMSWPLQLAKKLWPSFEQSSQMVHMERPGSFPLLRQPIPTALSCLAETARLCLEPTTKRAGGPTLNIRKGMSQVRAQKRATWKAEQRPSHLMQGCPCSSPETPTWQKGLWRCD